jgi:hypothetical protein
MDRKNRIEELLKRYSEEQILRAIVNSYKTIIANGSTPGDERKVFSGVEEHAPKPNARTSEPIATADHPPCGSCGGTFFLRTGTCHVCQTCGTSQGCS